MSRVFWIAVLTVLFLATLCAGQEVIKATPKGTQETSILVLGADWDGPCKSALKLWKQVHADGHAVRVIDIDAHPEWKAWLRDRNCRIPIAMRTDPAVTKIYDARVGDLSYEEAVTLAMGGAVKAYNDVSLLVGYDNSESSKCMFPILAKLRECGWQIRYANLAKTEIQDFEQSKHKARPIYLMYVGHECWESQDGELTEAALLAWLDKAQRSEHSKEAGRPAVQREYLKNDPVNMVYLRTRLSEPSCGMAWCMTHRYKILEYVDKDGNVVGKPQ